MAVRKHVLDEDVFLANYGDVLTDAPLDELVEDFRGRDKIAAFLAVRPTYTFHVVDAGGGRAGRAHHARQRRRTSGSTAGHFILRREIFDYLKPGDELVEETFERLIADGQLLTYRYTGFWAPMDTLKDMQTLETMYEAGPSAVGALAALTTMRTLDLEGPPLTVLALGAHADDLEIGCGGTLARLAARGPPRACPVGGVLRRRHAGRRGAGRGRGNARGRRRGGGRVPWTSSIHGFRDGYFPSQSAPIKDEFERLKAEVAPDLVFAPVLEDRHQDHRLIAELAWNTFRDHLILEYEIPKYEGDLGPRNLFVPLPEGGAERKVEDLVATFGSQRDRHWFDSQTFLGLMRLRGLESTVAERLRGGLPGAQAGALTAPRAGGATEHQLQRNWHQLVLATGLAGTIVRGPSVGSSESRGADYYEPLGAKQKRVGTISPRAFGEEP